MTTPTPTRKVKQTARERREAHVASAAETAMHDTRFDWLRTRGSRITLVVLLSVLLAAMTPIWIILPGVAALGFVILAIVLWLALRVSVRVVADLPEEYLDERQNRVRDRAYLDAYRWFAGITLLAATAGLIAFLALSSDDRLDVTLTWGALMGIFWTFEGLALTLPSMVVAVRERGE